MGWPGSSRYQTTRLAGQGQPAGGSDQLPSLCRRIDTERRVLSIFSGARTQRDMGVSENPRIRPLHPESTKAPATEPGRQLQSRSEGLYLGLPGACQDPGGQEQETLVAPAPALAEQTPPFLVLFSSGPPPGCARRAWGPYLSVGVRSPLRPRAPPVMHPSRRLSPLSGHPEPSSGGCSCLQQIPRSCLWG